MTAWLLWGLAGINFAAGLYLVRYSGGKERQRPEAVLVVGVLLVLTSLFLVSMAVKIHTQQQVRQQMDRTRPSQERGSAGTAVRQPGYLAPVSSASGALARWARFCRFGLPRCRGAAGVDAESCPLPGTSGSRAGTGNPQDRPELMLLG